MEFEDREYVSTSFRTFFGSTFKPTIPEGQMDIAVSLQYNVGEATDSVVSSRVDERIFSCIFREKIIEVSSHRVVE